MQSTNNQTYVPLRAGAIYIGKYDDVLQFDNVSYTISTDQNCQIEFYQSNDKKKYNTTTYNYSSSSNYVTNEFIILQRYIYVTIRNTTGTDQTVMSFNMIYRNATGTISKDVSVNNFPASQNVELYSDGYPLESTLGCLRVALSDSNGNALSSTGTALNVYDSSVISQITTTNSYLSSIASGSANSGNLWNAVSVAPSNVSASFSNGVYGSYVCLFGTSSMGTVLTVQYSQDNSTWYNSSNTISLSVGNFSLDFVTSSSFVRLINSGGGTSTVTLNYSVCR